MKIVFKFFGLCSMMFSSLLYAETAFAQQRDTLASYIQFSLSGVQINGVYSIDIAEGDTKKQVTNMVYPDAADGKHKIAEIDYKDVENKGSAFLKMPAQEGLVELTEMNRDKFAFGIFWDDKSLKARSVSFHVLEVVEDKIMKMRLSLIKGRFEGVMEYKFQKDGERVETYTVHGTFQYISPAYQKRLKRKPKS